MGINRWRFLLFPHLFQNSNTLFFSSSSSHLFLSHLLHPYPLFSFSYTMSTKANPLTRKRKYKGRNHPGPDRAAVSWKEEEFQNLVRDMSFRLEWGAQFPIPNSTALDAPPGYIALYAAFFREGNFRLPMTKFIAEVLANYRVHTSQINALGLPRLTHFEFICRANHIDPTFEMFNVFYNVSYTGGF
ncbi:hypothetical protein Hanom_Chr12g01172881 [Helianthus anomalus]